MIALALFAALTAAPTNVVSVLASAQSGDTVQFQGTTFDHVALKGRKFSPPLTLALKGATLVNLHLDATQGVVITDGAFKALPGDWLCAIYIGGGSAHVKISGPTIDASGTCGVTLRDGSDLSLENTSIDNSRVAVPVQNVDGFRVVNVTMTRMSVDGIDLYSSRHGYVAYNVCAGSYAVDGSHRDCIQLADTVSGAPPTSDIEIAFNLAHGDTQGFTSFRPNPGRLRINIHDNTAVLSQPQGLGFYDGQDSRVTSNHVWTLPSALNRSSVNIVGGNTVESCNAAGAGAGKSAWADKCP